MKRPKKSVKEINTGFFRKNYSLSWMYIKESFFHILIITFLLLFGFIAALIFQPAWLTEPIKSFMESILSDTANFNAFEMIIYILNNNLKSSFFSMFLGIIFGVMPVFTALSNGYVLGFVSQKSALIAGPLILFRLVPHGIFEFPAVILAMAIGIKLSGYQFSVKDKGRALSAFTVSFLIFWVMFFILFGLISASLSPFMSISDSESLFLPGSSMGSIMQILIMVSALVSYFLSNLLGNLVLEKEDRKTAKKELVRRIENSLRVFLFVVLPLLIIAAIIEGTLIFVLR